LTWWDDYQARRCLDRKTLYVNNMKNIISTEFKNSTSYNLVKINNVDRDVRIVEESSIIKNPNKKRLLCYPDETISVGDVVLWNSDNWICSEIDNTSEVSDVGLISRCNNILKFYDKTQNQNNILHEIPCIIVDKITTDIQENKFLLTIDCDILVMIANNDTNNLISPNDIFKIGRYSYYTIKPDDISKSGLIILPMKFTEEMQEEYVDDSENDSENDDNDSNYILTSESLPDNEIILTQTKIYEVNKYVDGVIVGQEFSFDVVGDVSVYQLVVLDGNSCSIKCLKSGSVITLKAIDDSNGEIVLKDIKLKNLF